MLKKSNVEIKSIYRVKADETYIVDHYPVGENQYIFLYTTKGSGVLTTNNISFEIGEQQLLIFSGETEFKYHTVGTEWEFWWFQFGVAERDFEIMVKNKLDEDIFLILMCEKILQSYLIDEFETANLLMSSLVNYTQMIIRKNVVHSDKTKLVEKALVYITNNLSSVNVEDVARYLEISTRSLHKLFIEKMSVSPKKYILKQKMESAVYSLTYTSSTIESIGVGLGYSDAFHFSKSFKKLKGFSPNKLRKER